MRLLLQESSAKYISVYLSVLAKTWTIGVLTRQTSRRSTKTKGAMARSLNPFLSIILWILVTGPAISS